MTQTTTFAASNRVIEETRKLYSNILSKTIDEKQLVRPTFKFIQELVKSLITETKILRETFTPADFDLVKRNWDRRAKVEFVQKLIDFVANNKQVVTNCVASRVIAGSEPNKTNELLQALARIAIIRRNANNERRPRTYVKPLASSTNQGTFVTTNNGSKPNSAQSSKSTATTTTIRKSSFNVQRLSQNEETIRKQVESNDDNQKTTNGLSQINNNYEQQRKKSINNNNRQAINNGSPEQETNDDNKLISKVSSTLQMTSIDAKDQNNHFEKIKISNNLNNKQQIIVANDFDINRNIPHLKTNLKSLRLIVSDISKSEELLKDNIKLEMKII